MTNNSYSSFMKSIHWLMAFLFLIMFILAYCMLNMPKIPLRMSFYDWHKATGLLLIFLLCIRIINRLKNKPSRYLLPYWQKLTSQLTVGLLYTIMLLMPITGFLTSSLGGHDVSFYYLVSFKPLANNPQLSAWFSDAHRIISYVMLGLVGLHVSAALYHRWIIKDDVFSRMWLH